MKVTKVELTPAEHVVPAPLDGWSAAELSEDELVDDQFIANDPNSSCQSVDELKGRVFSGN